MVDAAEGAGARDGKEDGAEAEGDSVVEGWEEDGGVAGHEEDVGEVAEAQFAVDGDAAEGEEAEPAAVGRNAWTVVAVVERFGQAEEHDEPGACEDHGGDPVAPAPAEGGIQGCIAAYDGCDVGAVPDEDDVDAHVPAALVHEEPVRGSPSASAYVKTQGQCFAAHSHIRNNRRPNPHPRARPHPHEHPRR